MLMRRGVLGAALALPAIGARAQAPWPSRAIRLVVPFGVGGTADIFTRLVGQRLQENLGQAVVVENRTGAAGTIGTDHVAKSPPDGYSWIVCTNTQTANETLMPGRSYDLLRDFAPSASLNIMHHAVVVHPSLPVNSIAELIAYAKANPGRLDVGSPGIGSGHHLASEVFKAQAGITMQHVPFRSSDQVRTAVVAGQVPLCFDPIPSMLETIRTGRVRCIGTTGPRRNAVLPDVGTVAEVLPGFEQSVWVGLLAPARTPPAILERMQAEVGKILADPAIQDQQARTGAQVMPMGVAEFAAFVRRDVEQHREWIRAARIEPM
ncbi:Bug family tripartite tricarboxylate transporter substrate binding protein [Falsiroseomonas ponticola]|uniref:Bug family tripartite tricarboxylate transporter substrate binding protein n=1 Tax=Falsiroseomonas ponticola TaxID=2786951 RepID=UPI0019349948|nr:tripartite tricarboxylate transporter substrate binding protein [Roseomonas ponticola]